MRPSSKMALVVAGSIAAGVLVGLPFGPAKARPMPRRAVARHHSRTTMTHENMGGPGTLAFRFSYGVAEPRHRRPGARQPDRIHFVVSASVHDEAGRVVVDGDPIGEGLDEVEVGDWSRDFDAIYRLPPGRYRVTAVVYDADRPVKAGEVDEKYNLGYSDRVMVVD
jgi:hypothetical protein